MAAVLVVAGAGSAGAEPVDRTRTIEWAACPDGLEGQCGTLSVPLDWNKPRGQRIDVAVARHRATDPSRRIGVLMVDPGGPGGSAALFALSPVFSPELRARFDIVGIDSRGTGNTSPILCDDLMSDAPDIYPSDEAGFQAVLRYNRRVVSQCRARSGPVFDNADGAAVARDMDAVRRALGERKISFFGLSYGTVYGQAYAEMFGDRVRAVALDSVVDHSADVLRFVGDRAAASDDAFAEFARWCDRTESCVLHGQDVYEAWEAALVRADSRPNGRQGLLDSMYYALREPDWGWAAGLIADLPAFRAADIQPNYSSVRLASVCQDFSLRLDSFREYARMRADELRRSPIMRGSFLGHDEVMACAGIAGPPANPPHRWDIGKAPTILVVNGRHDPTTPYAWAVNMQRQAPRNTVLLTYEGWGHVAYDASDCARAGVDEYLLNLRTPVASCPAVGP
ncbi:alpha/beta hydrolase [Lentzea sp. NPDC060358]|uniref:alpha/beta hydrolase n=1 Tax=Lentzea sp. NPDC060358 TaxID=3347103 RepID=UPI00366237C2